MRNRKRNCSTKGFTLIELIIVILTIGILAAIAIPQFTNLTNKAHKAANEATIGSLKNGLDLYATNSALNGDGFQYPGTAALSLGTILKDYDAATWDYTGGSGKLVYTKATGWVYTYVSPIDDCGDARMETGEVCETTDECTAGKDDTHCGGSWGPNAERFTLTGPADS